jgi:hypothetical protein
MDAACARTGALLRGVTCGGVLLHALHDNRGRRHLCHAAVVTEPCVASPEILSPRQLLDLQRRHSDGSRVRTQSRTRSAFSRAHKPAAEGRTPGRACSDGSDRSPRTSTACAWGSSETTGYDAASVAHGTCVMPCPVFSTSKLILSFTCITDARCLPFEPYTCKQRQRCTQH